MDKTELPDELHLRQLTIDEALPKLDKYLNDAFMAGLYQVKIIHNGYKNSPFSGPCQGENVSL